MKTVLITGGAGFIGSNLALKLIEQGYTISVLDNLSPQIHGIAPDETSPLFISIKDKVRFIKGSVLSKGDWLKALHNVEAVIHLAAETGTGQSMYDIERYINTNIGGTALLLDILTNTKHNVKKVLVAESRAMYGEGKYICSKCGVVYPNERLDEDMAIGNIECKCPKCEGEVLQVATTEDSEIHPSSVYGITKQVQGQLVHLICKALGIESVSFRYQNVYGPGQSLSNPYTGILSIFSTRIKNGNGIVIFEDGRETRDFVYIDDVVNATILGLITPGISGNAFNIGTGVPIDVLTVAYTLMKCYHTDVPVTISGNYRIGDIRHNYADISKARAFLRYEPKWTFDSGIVKFVDWVNKQNVQQDNYEISINEMREKGLYK